MAQAEIHAFDGPGSTLARRIADLDGNQHVKFFPCVYDKFPDNSDNITLGGFAENKYTHADKHVLFCMPHTSNDAIMQSLHALVVFLDSRIDKLTVVCPFVPSATMERVEEEGDVATANTLCKILSGLPGGVKAVRYMFYDLHTLGQRFYMHPPAVSELNTAVDAVCGVLHADFDWVFFPDDGARKRFGRILAKANLWSSRIGHCDKVRQGDARIITVMGDFDVRGKKVLLIDDLVRTGNTLRQCAKTLLALGAASVSAFCVHAAGSVQDLQRLAQDGALDALYITDSVELTARDILQTKDRAFFTVFSIASLVLADLLHMPRKAVSVLNQPSTSSSMPAGSKADDVSDAAAAAGLAGAEHCEEATTQATFNVLVCSQSSIKIQAVRDALTCMNYPSNYPSNTAGLNINSVTVHGVACDSTVSAQPSTWSETVMGCTKRLEHGIKHASTATQKFDLWIAIENGIDDRTGDDFAYVLARDAKNNIAHATSTSVHVPPQLVARCSAGQTYSELLSGDLHDPHMKLCKVGRAEILAMAVRVALGQLNK